MAAGPGKVSAMKLTTVLAASGLVISLAVAAIGGEPAVSFASRPSVRRSGGKALVRFALSSKADVEVAILDAKGKVVRHLAAGVLGGKTPPPAPLKTGLSQSLEWDGKDDYGEAAKGGPFKVRVRAGMGVKLEHIVGGDPYAYYSLDMNRGNHSGWQMAGLEAKSDGTVYVLGCANNYGPPALRAYDADGNYLRTVFPPPAGKPLESMKGWGLNVFSNGTWAPQFTRTSSPAITRTILMGDGRFGGVPGLQPTRHPKQLLVTRGLAAMEVGTDGTCSSASLKPFVVDPMPKGRAPQAITRWLNGPCFSCPTPGGDKIYISGLFEMSSYRSHTRYQIAKNGFWRDGRVWAVDRRTGKAEIFYSLEAKEVMTDLCTRCASPIGGSRHNPYAAFHGVAVDREGRVFVCDRLHRQIVVLDKSAKILRRIPVTNPDAVAVHPTGKTLYVTTRRGTYHKRGELNLVRFNDWSKDSKPSQTVNLCKAGAFNHPSFLAAAAKGGNLSVWVAYTALPVRVYRETGSGLKLQKDFLRASRQVCLDMQRIAVDPQTDTVYVAAGFEELFRIVDWEKPQFRRCYQKEGVPARGSSMTIDARRRHVFGQHKSRGPGWAGPVRRYSADGEIMKPVELGTKGDNRVTGNVNCPTWKIFWGNGDRGMAVAPDGSLATLDGTYTEYSKGVLRWFHANQKSIPWKGTKLGLSGALGGIRFDPAGNLYLGRQTPRAKVPAPFDKDKTYRRTIGRIIKYAPTGSMESGNLYPKPLAKPVKTYDVQYGPFGISFTRTPRFGVDGYGRIYYPNGLAQKVGAIDNQGNEILSFGKYGNRDSMGGLKGDLVPTKGIPLGCPNSVDATDDYIYVGDTVNIRLLRLAKTFAAVETVAIGRGSTE